MAYASQHAGPSDGHSAALIYRRDIRPALPQPSTGRVIDIGCGQGELVKLLRADGYDAEGVDVSPEQVGIAQAAGLRGVYCDDYRKVLAKQVGQFAAITATDFLEHLGKEEVLHAFDLVNSALMQNGVFVGRVPNAASPLSGHIRYGDFTHESSYTAQSLKQVASAAGFAVVRVWSCPPVAHGLVSSVRVAVWKPMSALCKLALAAETGILHGHIVTQNLTFAARKP